MSNDCFVECGVWYTTENNERKHMLLLDYTYIYAFYCGNSHNGNVLSKWQIRSSIHTVCTLTINNCLQRFLCLHVYKWTMKCKKTFNCKNLLFYACHFFIIIICVNEPYARSAFPIKYLLLLLFNEGQTILF